MYNIYIGSTLTSCLSAGEPWQRGSYPIYICVCIYLYLYSAILFD